MAKRLSNGHCSFSLKTVNKFPKDIETDFDIRKVFSNPIFSYPLAEVDVHRGYNAMQPHESDQIDIGMSENSGQRRTNFKNSVFIKQKLSCSG